MTENEEKATPEPAPTGETVKGVSQERTLALLAHLLGIVAGWVAPLIIYLVVNNDAYTKTQARESLNFQITLLIGYVIGGILSMVLIGFLVALAVWVYGLIMVIIAAMAVNKGEDYRYPFALRLVK